MTDVTLGGGDAVGNLEREPVVFNLDEESSDKQQSILYEEREKHRRRAERFGTRYVDPGRTRRDFSLMMEARKERLKASHGFTTGDLDLFSQEEQDKRAARAARFQLPAPLAPALDGYKPDEELQARARRAAKFGVPYQPTEAVLMDMDLYEQRREVGSDVERRQEAVYLYGVDVMSTREVLSYFSDYGPVFVEWLDDSSCNVLFADSNSAKRAMVGTGAPLPPQVVTADALGPREQQRQQQGEGETVGGEGGGAGTATASAPPVRYQPELPVPDNLADVSNLSYVWHKGRDFVKDGTSVSLVYRMATVLDVRDMSAPKRTRELWKAAGGGGGGGEGRGRGRARGRGGRGRGSGKRPFRQPGEEGDGPTDMDLDEEEPDAMESEGAEGDGEQPSKRQRGARGGQRLALRQVRPALQPYGGASLLQGGPLLPAKGHVLDYTELEDEGPREAGEEGGEAGGRKSMGPGWDGDGAPGGRRGRGGRGRGRHDGVDLRDVLKARRRAAMPPRREEEGEDGEDGEHVGGEDERAEEDANGEGGQEAAEGAAAGDAGEGGQGGGGDARGRTEGPVEGEMDE